MASSLTGKIRTRLAAAITILALTVAAVPALAATQQAASGGNGLRVSPVRTDLTVSPGTTQTVTIHVTNVTSTPANLQVIVNDFTAGQNETGEPAILLNPNQYAPSHSLKRFIAPISGFTLQPGEEKDVPVNISVPAGAAGGGYYGAVRFAPASTPQGDNNVTLSGSVGSLILIKVPGNIKEQVNIASFDVRDGDQPRSVFFSGKNLKAVVRFNNQGNVQEEPFGKVLLKKGSKVLGAYEVNSDEPRGNVLPGSIRRFDVPLNHVGSFGKYTLEGNFGYGSSGQLISAKTTFYVLPIWAVIVGILIILFILFLIFGLPRLIRAYNRRVIRRASRK